MKVLLEARVIFTQLHQALFMLTMQPLPPQKMKALFVLLHLSFLQTGALPPLSPLYETWGDYVVRGAEDVMKKPENIFSGFLLFVARLAGIEPTTPWFVAKYSIQLSYSREDVYYSK